MQQQEFYKSHQKLLFIKEEGQAILLKQKVLVIGAGGLGCPCLLALAGAGIGTIGIADFDKVSISNLHRQNLYVAEDEGKLKAIVAEKKLTQYNPFIKIQTHNILVDEINVLNLLRDYNIIVDCTDNFSTRYLINDACVYLDKPLVYGAIHQTEGHITVFNFNQSATLRCLFPKDENESIASCAEIGAYNITTSLIGNMMANEVIKISLHHPEVFAGKLKQLNVLEGTTLTIGYKSTEEGRQKSVERFSKPVQPIEITPAALAEMIDEQQQFFLIDVRETSEHNNNNIGGIHIPLQELLQHNNLPFSTTDSVIIYCQKGNRSRQAVNYLREKGFINAVSIQGGIELYQQLSI